MKKLTTIGISLAIILLVALSVFLLKKFRPEAEKKTATAHVTTVRAMKAKSESTRLSIASQGFLKPYHSTNFASEVSGKVIFVSPKFKAGSFCDKGDVLLKIDNADYQARLAQAEANLSQAKLLLEQEKVRSEKARRDWQQVGKGKKAKPIALREPQLDAAIANVSSATEAVNKAGRDLQRCIVKTEYSGRIVQTYTDIGNVVAPGVRIADYYANDFLEISLPINIEDMKHIYTDDLSQNEVVLTSPSINNAKDKKWYARIGRLGGQINSNTRSEQIFARLEVSENDRKVLVPGLYMQAKIHGKKEENLIKIPRSIISDNNKISVIEKKDGEDKLFQREISPFFSNEKFVFVKDGDGVKNGEVISLTLLPSVIEGMKVSVVK